MKTVERIFRGNQYLGIIHSVRYLNGDERWYITVTAKKNVYTPTWRTCGNGIVRKPTLRPQQCTDAMTWANREDAVHFLESIWDSTSTSS